MVLDNIIGFILNVPTDYKWGIIHLPVHRKHWITIRKVGSFYYNLDSKLDVPELVGRSGDLQNFLREQVACPDKEMLVIVPEEIAQTSAWMKTKTQLETEAASNGCDSPTSKEEKERLEKLMDITK